jgi:hypothetical protein
MTDEQAVRRMAADPDRLLPGEQTGTSNREDVAHWINVYTELQSTKRQLIANLRDMMARQTQAAQDELERADVRLLELQVERFDRRLAFWKARMAELDGDVRASADGHREQRP